VHGLQTLPFWLAAAGVATAWWFYLKQPAIPAMLKQRLSFLYTILDNKYYMDWFNERVIAPAMRGLGTGLWKGGDIGVIDNAIDGSARGVGGLAAMIRLVQSGYLYWYALVMILGVFVLMTWQLWPYLTTLIGR